jgi:hypothetical protein
LGVGHVPSQGLEKRVDELLAHLGFIVTSALIAIRIVVKCLNELLDAVRSGHGVFLFGMIIKITVLIYYQIQKIYSTLPIYLPDDICLMIY